MLQRFKQSWQLRSYWGFWVCVYDSRRPTPTWGSAYVSMSLDHLLGSDWLSQSDLSRPVLLGQWLGDPGDVWFGYISDWLDILEEYPDLVDLLWEYKVLCLISGPRVCSMCRFFTYYVLTVRETVYRVTRCNSCLSMRSGHHPINNTDWLLTYISYIRNICIVYSSTTYIIF